jgi:hypothetical protein
MTYYIHEGVPVGMKPWHLEGLFSGGEYEYLRSTVSGYFLVSKITPPAMASSFPSHIHTTYIYMLCMYVKLHVYPGYVVFRKKFF